MGSNALIRKLERFTQLTDEEKQLLRDVAGDVRDFDRHRDIISEGDDPDQVHLVLEGWLGRYKTLPNGEQPILAFLIPGDFCDLHIALLSEMDRSIKALSPCKVAFSPRQAISSILDKSDRLTRALWWATQRELL